MPIYQLKFDMTSPENKPPEITPSLAMRHGKAFIRLDFIYNKEIIVMIKAIPGRQWSQSFRCWFIPDTQNNRIKFGLSEFAIVQEPGAVDTSALSYQSLCQSLLDSVIEKIKLKAYSQQTLKSYSSHLKTFLKNISKGKNPLEVTQKDIEQYLLERQRQFSYSESDANSHINAIKFLYEQVLGRERMLFYLPRPEKPLQLPKVLGEHELERLFRSVPNLKHKAILLTAFSCGLRVGEVTKLHVHDLDKERMQVFIERSKGLPRRIKK